MFPQVGTRSEDTMTAVITPTVRWHCAASDYEVPCPACDSTATRWLYATPEYDAWTCRSCGFDFNVMVDDIEPSTIYLVGRSAFTERGMTKQFAGSSGQIEEIELYNDVY